MKRSKWFWISTVCTAGLLSSCLSSQYKTLFDDGTFFPYRTQSTAYSLVNHREATPEDIHQMNDAKSYFCADQKPKRALKFQAIAPFPKNPEGIPLDQAAVLRKKYSALVEGTVQNFFVAYAVYHFETSSYKPPFRSEPPSYPGSAVHGSYYAVPQALVDPSKTANAEMRDVCNSLVFVAPKARPTIFVLPAKAFEEFDTNHYSVKVMQNKECGFGGTNAYEKLPFLLAGNPTAVPDAKEQLQPLKLAHVQELNSLMEKYTFFPPEAQGHISSVVNGKNKLWERYFKSKTKVSESPQKDASALKFEVELNLDYFCKYGKRVHELVTQ